ncbi:MAG: hypothetical protein AAGG01_22495 [Planctomycetota bacterium]
MNGALWTILAAILVQPSSEPVPALQAAGSSAEATLERAWERGFAKARANSTDIGPKVDHSTFENPWIVRTKNYEVRMAGSRSRAAGLAEAAESMLKLYEGLAGQARKGRDPLRIDVMPTNDLYRQYGDDHSDTRSSIFGGFFDPNNPGGAAAIEADRNAVLTRMYVTHATAQQFLYEVSGGRDLQAALTQGFGAYMQSFWDYSYFVNQFEANRDAGRLLDLGELLSTPIDGFGDRAMIRLNQLAMTFVYLRVIKPETRSTMNGNTLVEAGPFDEYVRKAIKGESLAGDLVFKLLSEDTAALQKEILEFRGWR